MMHNPDTVLRKLRLNAKIVPAEVIMLIRDMDQRLQNLEKDTVNESRVEETAPARRRASKVSKKKVSSA